LRKSTQAHLFFSALVFVFTQTILSAPNAMAKDASTRVIYGNDDRKDLVDSRDMAHLRLAESTAALVMNDKFIVQPNGSARIDTQVFGSAYQLCLDEPFFDQPVGAFCTGFLVGPDLLATAGHCISSEARCKKTSVVFDFEIDVPRRDPALVSTQNIYRCQSVIETKVLPSGEDWALIRLDRPVVNRQPLRLRSQGRATAGDSLFVVGHPAGLPKKIADGVAFVKADAN